MFRYLKERSKELLRWSEQYTKTDMVYLASGGFWSVVGQSAAAFTSLALAVVVSRYLPKDVYGDYKYVLAVATTGSSFGTPGSTQVTDSNGAGISGTFTTSSSSFPSGNGLAGAIDSSNGKWTIRSGQ